MNTYNLIRESNPLAEVLRESFPERAREEHAAAAHRLLADAMKMPPPAPGKARRREPPSPAPDGLPRFIKFG